MKYSVFYTLINENKLVLSLEMSKASTIGNDGEQNAVQFLRKNGHQILFQNWRHKHLEVDIISKNANQIVFTEVKTRSNLQFGEPYSFVSKQKQNNLMKAANEYCYLKDYHGEIRFDIIAIYNNRSDKMINLAHFEDAFYNYGNS